MSEEDQRDQLFEERSRSLSSKVERCIQELIERIRKDNPTLNFDVLAPPTSHTVKSVPMDMKEFYFDFYLVWNNIGKIEIERDQSSICCQIKYLQRTSSWSRAEQARLLVSNVNRKRNVYLNGRAMRDLVFETLRHIAPDLIRLNFLEHLIYFDLIIPSAVDRSTCHVTLLPCVHLKTSNEVLLPFGTLRWYPRSLEPINVAKLSISFRPLLNNMSIRHYISTTDVLDETTKLSRKDHQAYARVRTIIHELIQPSTLSYIDTFEQLHVLFFHDNIDTNNVFFIPHRLDRNCNVFPAGQYLIDDTRARRFFREFLRVNVLNYLDTHQTEHVHV
jgi:hypothetical protein